MNKMQQKERIENPYCIIIPGKMHFVEKEVLETFKLNKK